MQRTEEKCLEAALQHGGLQKEQTTRKRMYAMRHGAKSTSSFSQPSRIASWSSNGSFIHGDDHDESTWENSNVSTPVALPATSLPEFNFQGEGDAGI